VPTPFRQQQPKEGEYLVGQWLQDFSPGFGYNSKALLSQKWLQTPVFPGYLPRLPLPPTDDFDPRKNVAAFDLPTTTPPPVSSSGGGGGSTSSGATSSSSSGGGSTSTSGGTSGVTSGATSGTTTTSGLSTSTSGGTGTTSSSGPTLSSGATSGILPNDGDCTSPAATTCRLTFGEVLNFREVGSCEQCQNPMPPPNAPCCPKSSEGANPLCGCYTDDYCSIPHICDDWECGQPSPLQTWVCCYTDGTIVIYYVVCCTCP
jgi:hypothetical protein